MSIDEDYNNVDFIPGGEDYPDRWAEAAREFREVEAAVGRARLNTSYGDHEREKFDLFHPAGQAEGLLVFVHGGYWRRFDRSDWSHFAAGATARGWAVAMPSYPLTPEVAISDITRSVAAAITKAASMVAGPMALAGHSAGGHLASRMLCADVDLPEELVARVRHVAAISPVSDLRPLLDTAMNADFRLSTETATAESPALQDKARDVPMSIWVGAKERPVFIDQARWLAEAWSDSALHVVRDRHHFDVIDALADPDSDMMQAILG